MAFESTYYNDVSSRESLLARKSGATSASHEAFVH